MMPRRIEMPPRIEMPRPITRLLIANRGEIAMRIIRACREVGIETVAVFSEIDRQALHVAAADRAVAIGPAPARDSYLSIPRLLQAAQATGADAIHPGYGFLSEHAAFAEACEQAHITFVGPPAQVLARMGSKIEARRLMEAAGVPLVPGETPADASDASLVAAIARVGVPALIKASGGGGGRGMRLVREMDDALDAIQGARREAEAAFGDGTLYVEHFLEAARHIEVQIMGDAHGQVVHLFERDCSVQRRHQKIIEESPSPRLDPALRAAMTDSAVAAGRAAGYRNAGTVEFLVAGSGQDARYYFLEMNARLQVEHPVTEEITGIDLVRAQLLVAAGEPLPWSQAAIEQRAHAIEARVYAEDPARDFVPQAGPLLLYREPRAPGIRIDSGVAEGSDVPIHYDPLLAKVIARAESRDAAIGRLAAALRDFPILGVRTNLTFLLRLLEHPRFRAGEIETGSLEAGSLTTEAVREAAGAEIPAFVRAAMWADEDPADSADSAAGRTVPGRDPWQTLRGWRG
jgi:acetyl-CoA carboxylase biotin carboxylase subunit